MGAKLARTVAFSVVRVTVVLAWLLFAKLAVPEVTVQFTKL
jgi:hypothetical protein